MGAVRLVLYGLALWGAQVVAGLALRLFASAESAIFDQLMDLALAGATALFAYLYLQGARGAGLAHGLVTGGIWLLLCIALDLPLLMLSGEMPPLSYVIDFLAIPVIAAAMGAAFARGRAAARAETLTREEMIGTGVARRDADAP